MIRVASAPASLAAQELEALMRRRQVIVADLPSPGPDADVERRLASALAGKVDIALLGDAPWARLQLSPAVRASIVAAEGLRPWAGLDCRDRNRVALRAELAALAAVGAPAVHCRTGRQPAPVASALTAVGLPVEPATGPAGSPSEVFDLDATQLTALAAQTGLVVSVAESPAAPPIASRPLRAVTKAEAGASVLFVNHEGDAKSLAHFVATTRALSPKLRVIVRVPMAISKAGADRLASILHGTLPVSVRASLEARDPVSAAISVTADVAAEYLGIDGVDGVELASPAGPSEEFEVAQALAAVGEILGGGT